jgi:serine/threonine-protein kinase RsbW
MIKNKLLQFHTEKIWQIETVLHEALVNAITYGNGLDPEKPVMMNYELGSKGLRVCISDCGPGFDIKNISVPVGAEALEKISGRGIYIMKKFSDALFYNRTGNEVVLFFQF